MLRLTVESPGDVVSKHREIICHDHVVLLVG